MPIMLSGQPGLPYNWTPRPDVGFGIGGLYGGAPYGIPKRRKPQAGFGLGELPWPLNLVAAGLMPLAKALGLSQPSATPQAMPPYRSPAATGGIAGGGIPMTRRFAGNEPQTPAYAQMWNRGTANRALAAASGTSPLTGPFSATRRYGTGGLAYALSQAALEGGAPMELVQRKARLGMAAGGYGYQMPASARQMRPSAVEMAAMLESGQPIPQGMIGAQGQAGWTGRQGPTPYQRPPFDPWKNLPPGQLMQTVDGVTSPVPPTPLPRRHGRISAPAAVRGGFQERYPQGIAGERPIETLYPLAQQGRWASMSAVERQNVANYVKSVGGTIQRGGGRVVATMPDGTSFLLGVYGQL